MVTKITNDNIESVKNVRIKNDAMRYVNMYDEFVKDINDSGMEISDVDDSAEREEIKKKLVLAGVEKRNGGKSFLLNAISPSCVDCRTGIGSSTYIISLACNRDCFFCTNKNQFNYEERTKTIHDITEDYKQDIKRYKKMKSVGITGGEPLLFTDKCADFIKKIKKKNKDVQTRIYSNGDLATKDVLEQLKAAGLDEIRFGVKLEDDGSYSKEIIDTIKSATKFIPRVMVEMPVVPGTLETMKELMLELDKAGVYSVNILEFLYPWQHSQDYVEKGYKVAKRPYDILFNYSYPGGLPIAGSELECLKLVLFLAEKKVRMGVHYCSLENKLTAQVYHHNHTLKLTGTEIFSENDFFIKTIRAYDNDIETVKSKLDEAGCAHYSYNTSDKFIEFSPEYLHLFKDMDMNFGLSYLVRDIDYESEKEQWVLREIQVDMLNTKNAKKEDL